ncbi:MAG TPA: hypothetical protein VHU40_00185, partial [Polyangia bacterium]|nr:hypothetical protein [Polyangia bacterium]
MNGPLVYASDDTLWVRVADPGPRIVLRPGAGSGPPRTFEYPPSDVFCDAEGLRFSTSGEYLQTVTAGSACVWRAADGALVTATLSGAFQTAVRGDALVMLLPDEDPHQNAAVVTRTFSGVELTRARLAGTVEDAQQFVLSPAGDVVAGARSGRLWDAATGAQIRVPSPPSASISSPLFDARGETVLMGDGLLRARDGASIGTAAPFLSLQTALDLGPGGTTVLTLHFGGVAALWDMTAPAGVRMLGPSTVNPGDSEGGHVQSLEVSSDGQFLLMGTRYFAPFAFRLAPRFEDSTLLSSMKGWLGTLSADGRFAASAG